MALNISKTNIVHFTLHEAIELHLEIDNQSINQKEQVLFLGMLIDSHLDWEQQINKIHNKIKSGKFIINKVKNMLSKKHLKTLYYSLIQSYIDYGLILYGKADDQYIKNIRNIQKNVIRIITHSAYNSEIEPLYKECKIMTLSQRYDYLTNIFMFRFYRQMLPQGLQGCFTRNSAFHSYNTRHRNDPITPKCNLTKTQTSIRYTGPNNWSKLPKEIKSSQNTNLFKAKLKQLTFK